jgi:indolepyruvate ferredoxin oxidoreductase alpha subunit
MKMKKRFAIAADAALLLAQRGARVPASHALVAPTLLRSQVLSHFYSAVRAGALCRKETEIRLEYLRGLRIRFFGDRVLQRYAWNVASRLELTDTYWAEYIAVAQLQADALVTLDSDGIAMARSFVPVASVDDLLDTID